MNIGIRQYKEQDQEQVINLWNRCNLTRSWNDPKKDITRKLNLQREYFFVIEQSNKIIASVMAGYDGHRGSVYYLAVDPNHQNKGYGKLLMVRVEDELKKIGCPKINLMVRTTNLDVQNFYKEIGYDIQDVIVLGKRLINDD